MVLDFLTEKLRQVYFPDPDETDQTEELTLQAFLGACDEEFDDFDEEADMPQKKDPIDVPNASREDLINFCMDTFEYCASFNRILTRKMLSMLSDFLLRHLVTLLQEFNDPDLSEARWNDVRTNADTPTVEQEPEFLLSGPDKEDDDGDKTAEITVARPAPLDPRDSDVILLPADDGSDDLELSPAEAAVDGDAVREGILTVMQTMNKGGIAMPPPIKTPGGSETPDPLFDPDFDPELTERWNHAT